MNPALVVAMIFLFIMMSLGLDSKNEAMETNKYADADAIANNMILYKRCIGEWVSLYEGNEYKNLKEVKTGAPSQVFNKFNSANSNTICPSMDWFPGPLLGVEAVISRDGASIDADEPFVFIYFDPKKNNLHSSKDFLPLVIDRLSARTGHSLSVGRYK